MTFLPLGGVLASGSEIWISANGLLTGAGGAFADDDFAGLDDPLDDVVLLLSLLDPQPAASAVAASAAAQAVHLMRPMGPSSLLVRVVRECSTMFGARRLRGRRGAATTCRDLQSQVSPGQR